MVGLPVSAFASFVAARGLRSARWACVVLTVTALGAGPRTNGPAVSLPIGPLGFQTVPMRYLASGGSMFTLHFLDSTHLLFTFNNRGLLKRMTDATPEDDDRNVSALLLELPSGRVLARTEWRTRDHEQYLWPLGHGRFLLRVRARLTVLDPLLNLPREDAFREQPFLDFKRRIGYIAISPGSDLLTVETVPPRHQIDDGSAPSQGSQSSGTAGGQAQAVQASGQVGANGTGANGPSAPPLVEFASDRAGRPPVDLHFYRLGVDALPGGEQRVVARAAGVLGARSLVAVPATADGFLDAVKESAGVYDFDFFSHAGKKLELSPYDTSCVPRPFFVSASEFIALGCRGGTERMLLSGFNLRGEEPWIQALSGQYIAPYLVTAPAAGRFGLSRVLVSGSSYDPESIVPEELNAQEVMILQHHDGRLLLKVQASPIQRAGQNFDLSPDGLSLAVLRGGNIEVYRLPGLLAGDEKALQMAAASAPEKNEAQVHLKLEPITPRRVVEEAPPVAVAAKQPEAETSAPAVEPEAPRKRPTLYGPESPKQP